MADDRRRQLRLILPPGINHAMRILAQREGRSESSMCVRLIAEAIDARSVAAQAQPEDLKRFLSVLALAAKSAAPADAAWSPIWPDRSPDVTQARNTGRRGMIERAELLLILSASDTEQLDALASLLNRGLVRPILDGDSIVAITATAAGAAKLNGVMLPPTAE
jgi:hypothetical protein